MNTTEIQTPALIIEADALERNLATMATRFPGRRLRPHVKAHKCTALAAVQVRHGHEAFTCATPAEVVGMAKAGLGADLLLANESVDPARLRAMADADAMVTVAIDSRETIAAATTQGIRHVVIDVNVGLSRCGCQPEQAGRLADAARRAGLDVRGVMGYEGHLMMMPDALAQKRLVDEAVDRLLVAHELVGGAVVSSGGTGTHHLHDRVSEVQAGSYALMDTQYSSSGHPFEQACFVVGTIISVAETYAVADVGLKSMAMDHGNPSIEGADVWFLSDEHITFAPSGSPADQSAPRQTVGDRIRVIPAHIDPTMAMHEAAWLVRGDEVLERWPIDLRWW